jgi:hypothetical protein
MEAAEAHLENGIFGLSRLEPEIFEARSFDCDMDD